MRQLADEQRILQFLDELGRSAKSPARIYLVGGSSAVLFGWRPSTIDIDLKISSNSAELLRRIPQLKESLQVNVELASPDQFIPALPNWKDRSLFIRQIGELAVFHYDFYSQALAKIERGHRQDLQDARMMVVEGLVLTPKLLELFDLIEAELYRFPAIDPPTFRANVLAFVERLKAYG